MLQNKKISTVILAHDGLAAKVLYLKFLKSSKAFEVTHFINISILNKRNKNDKLAIIKLFKKSYTYIIFNLLVYHFYLIIQDLTNYSLKKICSSLNIKYLNINNYDDLTFNLSKINPDIIINSASYILREEILSLPKYGVINLHGAPLPKYRGTANQFWAFHNKEKRFNTVIHFMNSSLDTGNIICSGKFFLINYKKSVFWLWIKTLVQLSFLLNKLDRFYEKNLAIPSKTQNFITTLVPNSYPLSNHLKYIKVPAFQTKDFLLIFKILIKH